MSGKPAMVKTDKATNRSSGSPAKTDPRILETRNLLGDALVDLLHTKHFEEITVQEVLDRAGVGRSTFYAHYRDKDDLFLSDVEDFLENCSSALKRQNASPERLLPIQELFEHIRAMHAFHTALVHSEKMKDIKELARGYFARSIEERLQAAGVEMEPTRLSAQAYALAGSVFSLLNWWIEHRFKPDARDIDALFHDMAWRGLSGI
jgi:AcrR family transcriptional regulator